MQTSPPYRACKPEYLCFSFKVFCLFYSLISDACRKIWLFTREDSTALDQNLIPNPAITVQWPKNWALGYSACHGTQVHDLQWQQHSPSLVNMALTKQGSYELLTSSSRCAWWSTDPADPELLFFIPTSESSHSAVICKKKKTKFK